MMMRQVRSIITDKAERSSDPAICVLVVDDSRLQRKILTGSLRKWGYFVQEADSGLSALEICRLNPPDIVISDWMMPGMDGLVFCRKFREMRRDSYGYFVLLTSKSEKEEIAQGLHGGADDFLTKPVNPDELRARLTAAARILNMEKQLQSQNHVIRQTLSELSELHQAMDRDLLQARKIQKSLLPKPEAIIGRSRISHLLQSCGHVGGDLVGHFSFDNHYAGFYNIDVSGHGITSAMTTARIAGHLSSQFPDQNVAVKELGSGYRKLIQPAKVAQNLNEIFSRDNQLDQYFTLLYGRADLSTGQISVVQAGHPNPVIIPRRGSPKFVGEGGFPVGLISDVEYSQFDLFLCPGDRLMFYSDGFIETMLPSGEMLEEKGLAKLIENSRHLQGRQFLESLYHCLWKQLPEAQQLDDDVSAILLEFNVL